MTVGPLKSDGTRDFIPDPTPTDRPVVPGSASSYVPPDQSSAGGAAGRAAIREALPTAAGYVGAEALAPIGAGIGAFGGPLDPVTIPLGGIIGGVVGALGGGGLVGYGQSQVLKANPDFAESIGQSPDQQQADEEEHPVATFVGGALPQAALLRPSGEVFNLLKGGSAAARAAGTIVGGAAVQGSVEAGQEYAQDGKIDPTKVALAAAQGAIFNKKTALGEMLGGAETDVIGRSFGDTSGGLASAERPTDVTSTHLQGDSDLLALPAATPDQVYAPESLHPAAAPDPVPLAISDQSGGDVRGPSIDSSAPIDQPAAAAPLALPDPHAEPAAIDAHFEDIGQGSTRTPPEPPQYQTLALTDQSKPMMADAAGNVAPPAPDLNFSRADILQRLRQANPKPDGSPGAVNQLTNNLSLNLAAKFATGDIQGAADVLQPHVDRVTSDEFSGSQREANTVAAAVNEVATYKRQTEAAATRAVPAPIGPSTHLLHEPEMGGAAGPAVAPEAVDLNAPVQPITGARADVASASANQVAPNPDAPHLAAGATPADAYEQGHRDALLSGVLDNPSSETPTASFLAQLRTKGHDDAIRPQESQRIADFEMGKAAAEQADSAAGPVHGDNHGDETTFGQADVAALQLDADGGQSPDAHEEGDVQGDETSTAAIPEESADSQAPEPAGPTDAQMSDKIDQLFRDKVISAKERAQFKALQEQVGTDGRTGGPVELNDRLDRFVSEKASAQSKPDRSVQPSSEGVGAGSGLRPNTITSRPAAPAPLERPTYAGLKDRISALHAAGQIDTQTHDSFSRQIAAREVDPDRIGAAVDRAEEGSKARVGGEAPMSPAPMSEANARFAGYARSELDKAGLHGVGVKLQTSLKGGDLGTYNIHTKLIRLSLDQSPESLAESLHHEMIHALRDLGMFRPAEWDKLVAAANRDVDHSDATEAAYPMLEGDQLDEEKVAELFAKSFSKSEPTTFVGQMVARLQKFLRAIKKAVGLTGGTADEIFGQISSGELAARGPVENPSRRESASVGLDDIDGLFARKVMDDDKTDPMHVTAADAYDGLTGKVRRAMLNLSTIHQIAEGVAKTPIGAIADRLADNLNQASQVKSDRVAEGAHVQAGWAKLSKGDMDALGKALFAANDAGVDVRAKGATGPEADKFNALSPEAKAVFTAAQDHLEHQKDAYIKIMSDTVMAGDGDAASKARDIAALKKSLSRVAYFPNMRIGDFTNVATKPEFHASKARVESAKAALADTSMTPEEAKAAHENYKAAQEAHEASSQENYAVTQHESREEQNAVAREMEAAGYTVSKMRSKQYQPAVHGPATALMSRLDAAWAADSAAHPERAAGNAGLQRMAHEIAGSMRPEGSALRNIMQRKGVAGYNTDAMRVFSIASRRNSGFLAAMETGEKLRQGLADIENRIKAMPPGTDTTKLDEVSQQLNKHFGALAKYSEQPVQTFLTNASYAWFLGCSPSFMMSHLMQTPLVTMPMLAAHFNPGRVAGELGKAFGEVTTHIGNLNEGKEATWGNTPLEKAAIRFAMEHATITSTHSDQFLGAGDKSTLAGDIGGRVMRTASFLPHYTEKANRVATLLASIRMAKDNPKFEAQLSDERYQMMLKDQPWLAGHTKQEVAAMKFANQITLDSHVDYSRENMSYVMQPGVTPMGKLMFQFQKYQQAMIYALAKNAGASFDKNLSGDEQWVARKTLAGIVGTHTLLTGLMGFPMAGLVATATNVYHKLVGDKDDPYDADDRFRTMLEQHLGKDAGDVAARGLLYAPGIRDVLPGDVTDRLGMGDLLVSGNAADGAIDRNSLLQYFGSLVGGPAGSLMVNISQAAIDHGQGDNWKASEELMPKVMRDISRTVRFSMDGVTTSSNNPVVKPSGRSLEDMLEHPLARGPDQMSTMDLVAQAMGFTPQTVETAYANRATVQDAKAELDARRKVLLKEFTDASLDSSSDPTQVQAMRDKINAYNAEQRSKGLYTETITGSEMVRSVQQRRLAAIRLQNGISLSPKQRGLINEYSSDGTPPPQ